MLLLQRDKRRGLGSVETDRVGFEVLQQLVVYLRAGVFFRAPERVNGA